MRADPQRFLESGGDSLLACSGARLEDRVQIDGAELRAAHRERGAGCRDDDARSSAVPCHGGSLLRRVRFIVRHGVGRHAAGRPREEDPAGLAAVLSLAASVAGLAVAVRGGRGAEAEVAPFERVELR